MNSTSPTERNRVRWFLAASVIALIVVTVAALALYPRWQAQQWEEELWVTTDSMEEQQLVSKLLRAQNQHADAVLTKYAKKLDNVVFAEEHRVVLFFDEKTGQPYSTTRWSSDNKSPNITAKFVNPRIVENIPEAVTIAAANEVNGSTCLFLFTYKHNAHVCDLTADELKVFEASGYWNEYTNRHGDPAAEKRKTWSQSEVKSWQQWKASVEAAFAAASQLADPKVLREEATGKIHDSKSTHRNGASTIEGEWIIEHVFFNGKEPADFGETGGAATFKNGTFEWSLGPEPVRYAVDPAKTPAIIDFTQRHNGEMVQALGIYKLQSDVLTLVLHEPPTSSRPTMFTKDASPESKGNQGGRIFLKLKRRTFASGARGKPARPPQKSGSND